VAAKGLMTSDTHRRLRDATRDRHERLEARLDILNRLLTVPGRRELVAGFHALHAGAEAALEPLLGGVPGLDFHARRRSERLARDLAGLGGRVRPSPPMPVYGVAQALGVLYVLEGSTLGGRVIRRHLAANGGDMAGLGFLDPYGAATGDRWRSFLDVLDAEADVDSLVAGAVAGFDYSERCLCSDPVHG
jgi:heme oxygenase